VGGSAANACKHAGNNLHQDVTDVAAFSSEGVQNKVCRWHMPLCSRPSAESDAIENALDRAISDFGTATETGIFNYTKIY